MRSVLIANRGEIALRVIRACFDENVESVLAVSAADVGTLPARLADRVVVIGPPAAADSYLSVERIVQAALNAGCDALHPGYGFLSERPTLVDACEENGITFIGPPADIMRQSGDKLAARMIAEQCAVPTSKGTDGLVDLDEAVRQAEALDRYPLLLKASAGGGGRGMTIIRDRGDLEAGFARSRTEALRAFGDGTLYLEPYIEKARHIEVQILADRNGHVCHLGERDCSAQRRYQKIIEEAPSAGLPRELVDRIRDAAVRLATALRYVGAATCEFLVDAEREEFVFLEINARVQVEHPVTEAVTGIDIVREQLRIARGEDLSFAQSDVHVTGHAIECRINAEDPSRDFAPSPGLIDEWTAPVGTGVRVDTYAETGARVSPFYDSLVAKVIVKGADRSDAIERSVRALAKLRTGSLVTTAGLQREILTDETFRTRPIWTKWLEDEFLPNRTPVAG